MVVVGGWVDVVVTTATVGGVVVTDPPVPANVTLAGRVKTAAVAPALCRYSIVTFRTPAFSNETVPVTVRSEESVQTLIICTPSTDIRTRSSTAIEIRDEPAGNWSSPVHRAVKYVLLGPQYVVLYVEVR